MTLLLLSGCATQSAEKTYRQITMEEAITMMEEETGYIILDVRTAQEYSEKHIPGSINIANESIGTEDISELPDKDQLILVYNLDIGALLGNLFYQRNYHAARTTPGSPEIHQDGLVRVQNLLIEIVFINTDSRHI